MVTGGAGYIGAHIVKSLSESGYDVVAFDDLSTGEARKIPSGVPLVEASVVDEGAVEKAIGEYGVTGIVHMAAKKAVGESVERPL
jgi:UDP-glucose 4-epimerase